MYGDFTQNALAIGTTYAGTAYSLVVPRKIRASTYDVVSDERLKESIQDLPDALSKVKQVKGVVYYLKADSMQPLRQAKEAKMRQYGFIAQDIRKVFPELVTQEEGLLAVNYQGLIPVLVEALKSLSQKQDSVSQLKTQLLTIRQNYEQLEAKSLQLEAKNQHIETQLLRLQQALIEKGILIAGNNPDKVSPDTEVFLSQNRPNPFSETTTITYRVDGQARQVSLVLTTLTGEQIQQVDNLAAGAGEIRLNGGTLPASTYVYTLLVEGKVVASRRLMLTK